MQSQDAGQVTQHPVHAQTQAVSYEDQRMAHETSRHADESQLEGSDIDIGDDSYVEDLWQQQWDAQAWSQSEAQRDKKVQHLESGMHQLQAQLTSLMQQLQPVISSFQMMPQQGRQQLHSQAVQPTKASVDWPAEIVIAAEQRHKVPGDGDCVWHALTACASGPQASPASVEAGKAFKEDMLARLQTKQQQHAELWGTEGAAVARAVEEWRTEWADCRAILSTAHEHSCTVLIFNARDRRIEAVTTSATPWNQRLWCLHFENDHYEPLPEMKPEALRLISDHLTFMHGRLHPDH